MIKEIIIRNDGRIACVADGKTLFDGTPKELAPLENGMAIKELIMTLKKVIEKLQEQEEQ